ncbi:MAG: Gfo/Idh/MocA family oxidoreductase [Candidatus Omnitrophica bacterium]|nr:Gfo/Idh/MocA family oxidoreductase [Candidatus Omnitrophota bacterium]
MKKVKVIHLGVGGRGVWPINLFKEREDFVSVAYVDVNKEAMEKTTAISGLSPEKCFPTLEEALEKVEADSVFIITPPQLHSKQCLQAVEAGKHILVEKPFTLSLKEAKDIVRKAEEKGLKVVVAQNARYSPLHKKLGSLIKEEVYGKPSFGLQVNLSWRPGVHHSGKGRHSYLWERSVHDFDTIRSFFKSQPKRVWGYSFNPSWSPYEHGACNYTWIEFEDGLIFGVMAGFAAHGRKNLLQIECENGSLEVIAGQIHLRRPEATEDEILPVAEGEPAESILLDGFYKYITEGVEPPFSGRENLKTIALVEASGIASDEGKIIEVSEDLGLL